MHGRGPKWVFKLINAAAGADTLRSIRPVRRFDCIVTAASVLQKAFELGESRLSLPLSTDQRLRISSLFVCCTVTTGYF